jgi:hypothetical protein
VFSWFERLHDGVAGLVKMPGRMLVFGGIAAANVATFETEPQMNPGISRLQTFFAAIAARGDVANLLDVLTGC